MNIFGCKAFVRKFTEKDAKVGKPVTMITLLVDGDIPSLATEATYLVQKGINIEGTLIIGLTDPQNIGKYDGWLIEDILKAM